MFRAWQSSVIDRDGDDTELCLSEEFVLARFRAESSSHDKATRVNEERKDVRRLRLGRQRRRAAAHQHNSPMSQ